MNTERLMKYKELNHKRMSDPNCITDFNVENHIRNFNALPINVQKIHLRSELRSRYGGNRRVKPIAQRLADYKYGKEFIFDFMLEA